MDLNLDPGPGFRWGREVVRGRMERGKSKRAERGWVVGRNVVLTTMDRMSRIPDMYEDEPVVSVPQSKTKKTSRVNHPPSSVSIQGSYPLRVNKREKEERKSRILNMYALPRKADQKKKRKSRQKERGGWIGKR